MAFLMIPLTLALSLREREFLRPTSKFVLNTIERDPCPPGKHKERLGGCG
jgi:hypothetical protein